MIVRKIVRRVGWPFTVFVLVCGAFLSATLLPPPTAVVSLIGGDSPTVADGQWARGLVGLIIFIVLVACAMVILGRPAELSAGGFSIKSQPGDKDQEEQVEAKVEEALQSIEEGLILQARLANDSAVLRDRVDQLERLVEDIRAYPGLQNAALTQVRLDEQAETLKDLRAYIDLVRTVVLGPGAQSVDSP